MTTLEDMDAAFPDEPRISVISTQLITWVSGTWYPRDIERGYRYADVPVNNPRGAMMYDYFISQSMNVTIEYYDWQVAFKFYR